jgi:predicted nucleotidyltransferase
VIPLNSDFRDLLSLLNRYGVRYLIVGGYAVMLYTEPRYTKDLDVVIGTQPEELEGVRRALEEFGFPMSDDAAAKLALPNRMIKIGHPPSRINIPNEIEGVPFDEAWHRRGVIDVEGVQAPFISLQDLIAAKRAAGRPQDLLDLAELERAAKRKG